MYLRQFSIETSRMKLNKQKHYAHYQKITLLFLFDNSQMLIIDYYEINVRHILLPQWICFEINDIYF